MRLAIIIEGERNSGKTSTIKHLINKYGVKGLIQMKEGWQNLSLNPSFMHVRLLLYCIPSSPSETSKPLVNKFKNWIPEVILLAEQPTGSQYHNSITYLNSQNYHILKFSISNLVANGNWDRFDQSSMQNKLDNRSDEITGEIRRFLRLNGII